MVRILITWSNAQYIYIYIYNTFPGYDDKLPPAAKPLIQEIGGF